MNVQNILLNSNPFLLEFNNNLKSNKAQTRSVSIPGFKGISMKPALSQDTFVRSTNSNLVSFTGDKLSAEEIRNQITSGKGVEGIPYKELQENFDVLPDIFNMNLTPVDNADIIAQRKKAARSFAAARKQTVATPSCIDPAERKIFKQNLLNKLYNVAIVNKEPVVLSDVTAAGLRKHEKHAEIVIGLAGTGKTPIAKKLAEENGALLIDGDITRNIEPQYRENAAIKFYKQEQKAVEKELRQIAIEGGKVTVDGVETELKGGCNFVHNLFYRDNDSKQLRKIARDLKDKGYTVNLTFVHLPVDEAAKRVVARNIRTDRFMDPLELYCVGNAPSRIYEELKKTDCFDCYSKYSTDVSSGIPPMLEEHIHTRRPEKEQSKSLNYAA